MDKRLPVRPFRTACGVYWAHDFDELGRHRWSSQACYPIQIIRLDKKGSHTRFALYERSAQIPFAYCLKLPLAFRVARNHIQWRQRWNWRRR